MATTPVQFEAPSGLTLTLELYPYGSDTIANGAGGDSASEKTNAKGLYSADVTESVSGLHNARVKDGNGNTIATYHVQMADDTSIHRCGDFPTSAAIADQVWDEAQADHTTADTFGARVQTTKTNTDTLLSRIPSALFNGITSLAQWLGLLAGKQTGNSTARTEIRATGAGSGTFDETTDSQEALRDNHPANFSGLNISGGIAQSNIKQVDGDAIQQTSGELHVRDSDGNAADWSPVYQAKIELTVDDANSQDEYTVQFYKDGAPVTSGVSGVTIQVIKRSDGPDLVSSGTSMTAIGSTGAFKYDEGTNRVTAGEAVIAVVSATTDSGPRTFRWVLSRDSS